MLVKITKKRMQKKKKTKEKNANWEKRSITFPLKIINMEVRISLITVKSFLLASTWEKVEILGFQAILGHMLRLCGPVTHNLYLYFQKKIPKGIIFILKNKLS